jgi:hypothetical protein
MAQVSSSGASWLRINVPWEWVEREEGVLDWNRADLVVAAAERNGISLLVTIRGYTQTDLYGANDERKLQAYGSFVGELVRRYLGRIRYWQIENEVTAPQSWRAPLEEYVSLLKVAYKAIKSEDPLSQVVLTSFGSNLFEMVIGDSESKASRENLVKLQMILQQGAGHYDILDAHLYHSVADLGLRIAFLREEARPFAGDLPIWVTETGGPDPRVDRTGGRPSDTPADQVPKRYASALAAGVERMFWHQIAVRPGRTTVWSGMALIEGDEPRPTLASYGVMTRMLAHAESLERLTDIPDVEAYRFSSVDGDVYLIWSDIPQTVSLPFATDSLRITRVTGQDTVVSASALTTGPSPLYVEEY